jgi:hypothetical protein
MVLGMSIQTFTMLHVAISLIGIGTGLIVVVGMLSGNRLEGWTAVFLITTLLTSLTGFLFPASLSLLLPSQITGIVSLVVLLPTLIALYAFDLAGFWRWVYIGGAMLSLYLNVLVGVVQAFQKISFLQPLAPTQSELPFLVAQAVVLIVFCALGFIAVLRFRPGPVEV